MLDIIARRPIEVAVIFSPLKKTASRTTLLEGFASEEEIMFALTLALTGRACCCRNGVSKPWRLRTQRIHQGVFTGSGRAGYDEEQPRTGCQTISWKW